MAQLRCTAARTYQPLWAGATDGSLGLLPIGAGQSTTGHPGAARAAGPGTRARSGPGCRSPDRRVPRAGTRHSGAGTRTRSDPPTADRRAAGSAQGSVSGQRCSSSQPQPIAIAQHGDALARRGSHGSRAGDGSRPSGLCDCGAGARARAGARTGARAESGTRTGTRAGAGGGPRARHGA